MKAISKIKEEKVYNVKYNLGRQKSRVGRIISPDKYYEDNDTNDSNDGEVR